MARAAGRGADARRYAARCAASLLAGWCAGVVCLAGAYAFDTLAALVALPCDVSLDPQRFCVWWGHSALPTLLGVPAVLAFGCYASLTTVRRRPVTVAGRSWCSSA